MNNGIKEKPCNYIYNKNLLKKIQVVDQGRKTNEMEMKNYAEEIDTHIKINREKKNKIKFLKENTYKDIIFSNTKVPQEWKNKINYYNFAFNTVSSDKDLLEYLLHSDLEFKKREQKIPESKKQDFYQKRHAIKKDEKEKEIARLFARHKEIKRRIGTMLKGDDNLKDTESIFGENFIYNKPTNIDHKKYSKNTFPCLNLTTTRTKSKSRENNN